jgi:hypothetical protein
LATRGGRLVALSSAWAKVGWFYEVAAGKRGVDALLSARHRRGYTPAGMREKATKDRPTMNPAKTGISRLLIASAIDPDVYRRLLESPEETFDAFDLADEDRELLRHPDHRLLRVLGAALAEENAPVSAAASVATMSAPPAVAGAPLAGATRPGAPPGMPTASAPLPDMSLVLTLVPCALYDGGELRQFAYAAWVSPLPEGADPEALPPPPGTELPGKPLPPLRAVVRVAAIQLQDAAGHPLVGLSASLLQSTNLSALPPPEAAGNPAAIGRDLSAAEVQAAIAAVRCAPAGARYGKLIELLRVLHPEGTS